MGDIAEKLKNRTKQAAKETIKQAGKMVAKLALKVLLFLVKNPIGIGIIILFIIICAISSTETTQATTTVNTVYSSLGFSEGTNNFIGLVEIANNDSGYYWKFKSDIDEKINDIIEGIESTSDTYNISDAELLKKMIKAELVTTLPNLGGTPDEDINCFQGIVNIQGLTYIPKSEFENNISEGSEDAGNYYSVNTENSNIMIANSGVSSEVNLQNTVLSKYSVSFEFLLHILMSSGDAEFVGALADNVLSSYINTTISSTELTVNEAYTWCVKLSSDGSGNVTVDATGSAENSMFSKLYNEYNVENEMNTNLLFEYMNQNSKTLRILDMTKYLIYCATGQEYDDISDYDFSGFTGSTFNNVTSSGDIETFKRYLHEWEGNTGYNEDGTMYRIGTDGAGHTTVGYGIDIENSGFKQRFIDAGYPTYVGGYVPVEFVDALEDEEIENNINYIKDNFSGLNLTSYQIYALTSRMYNCGPSGATGTRNGMTFVEAYNAYWNQETDNQYGEIPSDSIYTHQLYTNYMNVPVTSNGEYMQGLENRRKSEWVLFATGYYDRLGEFCSESSTDDFISVAKDIWKRVCNGNYTYGGSTIPCNNGTIDCSSYVSWVLYEYGYNDFAGAQHNTTSFLDTDFNTLYGWDVISVESNENPINKLQAGDLLVRRASARDLAHITLVVDVDLANNKIYGYDCGNESNWANNTNGDTINITWFLNHSGSGKIIRVNSPN